MKKTNISIFLNYKKSRNIFLFVKRFIVYNFIKKMLRKENKIQTFKNNYQLLNSTNLKVCRYFSFSKNELAIVLGDEHTIKDNVKLILELKTITENVVLLLPFTTDVNVEKLSHNLQIPIVGINIKNRKYLKEILKRKIEENSILKESVAYPTLVEEQLNSIEKLFPETVEEKRKRFLALQLLSKNFSFIEEIINTYGVSKYSYFRRKQELMEYGYSLEYLEKIYLSFYEEQAKKVLK